MKSISKKKCFSVFSRKLPFFVWVEAIHECGLIHLENLWWRKVRGRRRTRKQVLRGFHFCLYFQTHRPCLLISVFSFFLDLILSIPLCLLLFLSCLHSNVLLFVFYINFYIFYIILVIRVSSNK
jgi:hypothetical protein